MLILNPGGLQIHPNAHSLWRRLNALRKTNINWGAIS